MIGFTNGNTTTRWGGRLRPRNHFGLELLEARRLLAADPLAEQFLVNESFAIESSPPALAILNADGDFVAAWESYEEGEDYLGFGIYVQRFFSDGSPMDLSRTLVTQARILVNPGQFDGDQLAPAVASDGADNYLVAWQSKDQDDGSFDVYARWFDGGSSTLGAEFQVNTFTDGDQAHPAAAMDADGDAVIAWQSAGQDGEGFGIMKKSFALGATTGSAEEVVNTFTAGDQTHPSAAANPAGQVVIVWQGLAPLPAAAIDDRAHEEEADQEIYARQYNADGTPVASEEVLVNTTSTRDQVTPDVAMDDAGNFVATWVSEGIPGSGSDIFGQRVAFSGSKLGGELAVNPTTAASQAKPTVGMKGTGEFIIAWQSVHLDGFSWGIFAHEYDASGATVTGRNEMRINNHVMGPQNNPAVAVHSNGNGVFAWLGNDATHQPAVHAKLYDLPGTTTPGDETDLVLANFVALEDTPPDAAMDAAGNSVVVWESYGEDGDGLGVFAKRLDPDGVAIGDAFLVNAGMILGNQAKPAVAGNAAGSFVVVWESDDPAGPGHDVYGQRYDVDGSPLGTEFLVNSTTAGDQSEADAAMAEDGSFVVAWQSPDEDGLGIFAQRYDRLGNPIGGEFQVNNERALDQFTPDVAMNSLGEFVMAWVSDHPAAVVTAPGSRDEGEDSEKSIFVQWFDANGRTTGDEVIAHIFVEEAQEHPSVGIDADGNFVVAWQSINQEGQVGGSWGVYGRQFDSHKTPLTAEEFQVNEATAGPQRYPTVGVDPAGNFAIAFQSNGHLQDGSSWEVYLRQYDAHGLPLRGEELINTWSQGPQINPVVARSVAGQFGVYYSGQGADHLEGTHGRLYSGAVTDLVTHWDFEGDATDVAPSGVKVDDGVLHGDAGFADGVIGAEALELDGVGDYLSVAGSPDINAGTRPLHSVSLWFYPHDALADGRQVVYHQGGGLRGMNVYLEDGVLYGGAWNGDLWDGTWIQGSVIPNAWNHAALVLNAPANEILFYVNGALAAPAGFAERLTNHNPASIGMVERSARYFDETTGFVGSSAPNEFDGLVDDVRVFTRALEAPDAYQLSAMVRGDMVTDLVTYWNFEGDVLDQSPIGSQEDDGVLMGDAALAAGGVGTEALNLDGDGDFMSVAGTFDVNRGARSVYTVSLWFFPRDAAADGRQVIYHQGGRLRGMNVYLEDGELFGGAWNGDLWDGTWIQGTVVPNAWNHVALALDASANELQFYVQGGLAGPAGFADQLTNHSPATIGIVQTGARYLDESSGFVASTDANPFDGMVDDVRIFSRSIDALDARQLALTPTYVVASPSPAAAVADVPMPVAMYVPPSAQIDTTTAASDPCTRIVVSSAVAPKSRFAAVANLDHAAVDRAMLNLVDDPRSLADSEMETDLLNALVL